MFQRRLFQHFREMFHSPNFSLMFDKRLCGGKLAILNLKHVSTGVAKLFITIFKESQSPAVGFLYQYQVEEPRKTLAFPSWAEHLQGLRQSDMTASCLISSTAQALRQRLDAESSFFQRLQLDGKGKVRKEMWCKLPSLILKRLKDIVSLIIASLFSKSYQGHGF